MTLPSAEDISAIAVTLLAGSELLSLAPGIKANGWIQLIVGAISGMAEANSQTKRRGRR